MVQKLPWIAWRRLHQIPHPELCNALSPQCHPSQVWLGECTGSSNTSSAFLQAAAVHTHTAKELCLIATFCHSWGLFYFCCPSPFASMTLYNIIPFVLNMVAEHCVFHPHILPIPSLLVSCPASSKHLALWLQFEMLVTRCAMLLQSQWVSATAIAYHILCTPTEINGVVMRDIFSYTWKGLKAWYFME